MATTTTRNLKLRINSNLTADAKYNLERIDTLGATFLVDSTESLLVRSKLDIDILPNDNSIGGSGVGGNVNVGTPSQPATAVNFYSNLTQFSQGVSLNNEGAGDTNYLKVRYFSANAVNRILSIDLGAANRTLTLGGDFETSGGNLELILTGDTSVTLPQSGVLSTIDGAETLVNKTIDADLNTILNIDNNEIKANAGIVYSKLSLINSIVNADINTAAAISYSKLNLVGSIVNADVAALAAIAYSKLALTGSILNADISASAAIAYSKLALANSIVNADISASAAIAGSKVVPTFGAQEISTTNRLSLFSGANKVSLLAPAGLLGNYNLTLPVDDGILNQVLVTDGNGNTSWQSIAGSGTVTSVDLAVPAEFTLSGNPITTSGTITISKASQLANLVYASPDGAPGVPVFRSLVLSDLPALSTTVVSEGTNLYYTDERVDDRVAALIQNGTGITWTYDDVSNTFTGNVSLSPFTTSNLTEGSNLYFTDERAQDAVGTILADTASIDFTYNDGLPSISAVVLPAGVNHNALANYVANEHVNHASVAINTAALSGLAGGGDITTSRSLVVNPNNATSKATPVGADEILLADSAASFALKKTTLSALSSAIGVQSFKATWLAADGLTKVITHSLGSQDVIVQIYDNSNLDTIEVDTAIRTDSNTVTLTASQTPAISWRVLVLKV